jgi:hypothetical protein
MLLETYKKGVAEVEDGKTLRWRTDPKSFRAPADPQFMPGSVDLSPGWFLQGFEVSGCTATALIDA